MDAPAPTRRALRRARRSAAAAALAGALTAALLGPAAEAKPGGPVARVARAICVEEKRAIGKKAFRKRYGERRAVATCVRRHRGKARRQVAAAVAFCEEELAEFPEDFYEEWASFDACVLEGSLPAPAVDDEEDWEDWDEEDDSF